LLVPPSDPDQLVFDSMVSRHGDDCEQSGPSASPRGPSMHWNGMKGAANFVRGPTFDPVAQVVEQRTLKGL